MFEKREIYRAIGELVYVIAKAHDGIVIAEKKKFYEVIEKELNFEAWAAQSRFELLDEVTHPTLEHAYNDAMFEFRKYKDYLTEEMKEMAIRVLQEVANAYKGSSEFQNFILDRFMYDINHMN